MRFWNGEDGTVQMRGAFDAEMGARIQARIRNEAERLRQADRRLQRTLRGENPHVANDDGHAFEATVPSNSVRGETSHGDSAVRTRDQRMADALDRILTRTAPTQTAPAHDAAVPGTACCDDLRNPASGETVSDDTTAGCICAIPDSTGPRCADSARHQGPSTQVIVRADLGDLLDGNGIGEIAGTGPVPASAVERLCCNAEVSIVLFDKELNPVYEAVVSRAPTTAQRRALIARDGGCIGCGAPPGECEAHHIIPWKRGGPTRIDNLVLVCWSCHDKIHDHNWQVVKRGGRHRLWPPDPTSAPNPAPSRKPAKPKAHAHTGKRSLSDEPAQAHRSARSGAPVLFP